MNLNRSMISKLKNCRLPKPQLLAVVMLSFSIIIQPVVLADQLALPSGDLIAPVVEHEPPTTPASAGNEYTISAKVTDNKGVKNVLLFYRAIGQSEYNRVLLKPKGNDIYAITLEGDTMNNPGLEYYIQAEDLAGNTLLHGYSFSPLIVKVTGSASSTVAGKKDDDSGLAGAGTLKSTSNGGMASTSILKNKWLWIGLGVVVAGAALSSSDDPAPPSTKSASVTITADAPQ